jgi:2-polyprenyl-6-methoxyphenol hydroxylase-like FAD-dependent oxidoreductase
MRVGIIGAGVGGLATAVGLQRHGVEAHVFEQSATVETVGSGLSIFGNGRTALRAIGLGHGFDEIGGDGMGELPSGQRRPDGRWLAVAPAAASAEVRVVHRAALHALLVSALAPRTLHLGTAVSADTLNFDVVVGADGLRSRTRELWADAPAIRYAGYSAWRGVTDGPFAVDAASETWGDGLRFGIAPLADGRVYWFAVASMPESRPMSGELRRVQKLFAGWHDPVAGLLAATDPATVIRHPIADLATPLRSYVRDRTVLLGDAAHAMTPDLGQGANQALEDAATLSILLGAARTTSEIDTALARYDDLRLPRTQLMARRSRLMGRVAQSSGRLRTSMRDTVMRMAPPSAMGMQLAAIQAWEPPRGFTLPG